MHTVNSSFPSTSRHSAEISVGDIQAWVAAAITAGVVAYGLGRRSARSTVLAVGAAPLIYGALTGRLRLVHQPDGDSRTALGGGRGIHVRDSVRIEKPVAEVYRFWRQLDNLPRFMCNLDRVVTVDDTRSHWVALGPAGLAVEWDARIINDVENTVIAWQSLPGSDIVTAGSVNFDAIRNGQSTQLSVNLQYSPPAGSVGASIAKLFGREPAQTIREDLRRLKQLLEAGEIPANAADRVTGVAS